MGNNLREDLPMNTFKLADDYSEGIRFMNAEELLTVPFYDLRVISLGNEDFLKALDVESNGGFHVALNPGDAVSRGYLLKNTLRMRPDTIIMSGEFYSYVPGDAEMASRSGHEVIVVTEV